MEEAFKYYGSYYIRSKRHDVYVSNFGNVKDNGKLKENPTKAMGERIYNVVAKLFLPNPENKPQVDHIDTNRKNNRVDNLRWVTPSENMHNRLTRQHCSEAAIKRWSDGLYENAVKKMKGRTAWNKGLTKETDERVRKYSKPMSEETKRKISEANKGKMAWSKGLTMQTDNRITHTARAKTVYQYTLNGDFVAEYPSTREAARQTGFSKSGISEACIGNFGQLCGYLWKYNDKKQDKHGKESKVQ